MKRYEVTADGWLDGSFRRAGDTIELDAAGAKYLLLSGQIAGPQSAPAGPPAVRSEAGETSHADTGAPGAATRRRGKEG